MKTIFLKTALLVAVLSFAGSAMAKEHNDNGSAATYALSSGEVLNINAGTFTGTISSFASGAIINVKAGATFNPAAIKGNAAGTWNVYGTVTLSASASLALTGSASLRLNNWGTFSATDINVGSGNVVNAATGKLYFNSFSYKGEFDNAGEVYITNEAVFSCNSCTFQNRPQSKLYAGSLSLSANLVNEGYIYSQGLISKTGGSYLTNHCTMVSSGGMTFDQGIITNNGFMIVLQGLFTNVTSFTNGANALVQGVDFTNGTAEIKGNKVQLLGAGNFRFTGSTTHQGNGGFGVDGTASHHINFYDASRSSPTQIVDNRYVSIHSSVTNLPVVFVDTSTAKAFCTTEGMDNILPVRLVSFAAQQGEGNRALIRWTVAEQIAVKQYEIEYSTNGNDFTSKEVVLPGTGSGSITYTRKLALPAAGKHYFRLKVVNAEGPVQYSSIVVLHTEGHRSNTFTISGNPARSQTTLLLSGHQQGAVIIELLGRTGEVLLRKDVQQPVANSGVSLTGLERFSRGLYYVRITGSNGTDVQKLILQ